MGRNKLIEDEKLLDLFDNFLLEVCGGNPNAFRYSDFSNYVNDHGYVNITPRLLRRNEALRTHIAELPCNESEEDFKKVLAFKTLDVDLICSKSSSSEYLRSVLTQTDSYYRSLYEYAVAITKENQKLKKELERAKLAKKDASQKTQDMQQTYKEEKV